MGDHQLRALRVLACNSRMRIMRILQERQGPVPVEDVAAAVGLHVNTTREHLDRLVASGFVDRQPEHRTTRGRPRMLYRSVDSAAAATVDSRARGHLVRLLLDGYGKPMESPITEAELAGVEWAAQLGCPGTISVHDDDADAEEQLTALMHHLDELGFDPELQRDSMQLSLSHCPFADVPTDRKAVVCASHLGLARGVLARHEGPLVVEALEPRGTGDHCMLRLAHV
jgi:predicted ArsR family transcriptional regulator